MSGGRWFVGSFEQTLPPIVPRFRTWTSAIVAQTSPRIGRAVASAEPMSSVYVVIAPIVERPVAGELDPLQLVEPVQVDEHVRRGGARLHDVDQRLAAGERAGAVVRREDRERLGRRTPALRTRPPAAARERSYVPGEALRGFYLRRAVRCALAQAAAGAAGAHGEDLREDRERGLRGRLRADVEPGRARRSASSSSSVTPSSSSRLAPALLVAARAERADVERVGRERAA